MPMPTSGVPDATLPIPDPTTAEVLRAALHDLKGPTGRLRVLVELVNRNAAVDEETGQLLKHIADSALALDAVVEGLRTFSDLCMRPLQRERVDLTIPLLTALANREREIKASGAEVIYAGLPELPIDRAQITWLFEELLTNAIRFRGAGPPAIRVTASPGEGGDWLFSVSDNGPGVDAQLIERVFRPFKKVSRNGGAGLGLTICRRIAEMHGGRIWWEPRDGGADIRFVLHA